MKSIQFPRLSTTSRRRKTLDAADYARTTSYFLNTLVDPRFVLASTVVSSPNRTYTIRRNHEETDLLFPSCFTSWRIGRSSKPNVVICELPRADICMTCLSPVNRPCPCLLGLPSHRKTTRTHYLRPQQGLSTGQATEPLLSALNPQPGDIQLVTRRDLRPRAHVLTHRIGLSSGIIDDTMMGWSKHDLFGTGTSSMKTPDAPSDLD